jgi:hypothetical protein
MAPADPGHRIAPYDPTWPLAFEAEAARLRHALGAQALRIDDTDARAKTSFVEGILAQVPRRSG